MPSKAPPDLGSLIGSAQSSASDQGVKNDCDFKMDQQINSVILYHSGTLRGLLMPLSPPALIVITLPCRC